MARLWVVMEELESDDLAQWVLGIHLSRNSALEFVKTNSVGGRHLYIVDASVIDKDGDTNENTFLRLQRSLSRVERRLGKAREALRLANQRVTILNEYIKAQEYPWEKEFEKRDIEPEDVVMADPVFQAHWVEPEHADD